MSEIRRPAAFAPGDETWQDSAACRDRDTEMFFHPDGERGPRRAARERAAKAICATCPVQRQCADYALRIREPYGIWGGLSEADRAEILAGRRRYAVAS